MHLEQVLRRIDDQSVEIIQRGVQVNVQGGSNRLASFCLNRRVHEIVFCLGPFQGDLSELDSSFLVQTSRRDIFLLYRRFGLASAGGKHAPSQWILAYRILRDDELMAFFREDQMMLVNAQLKKVVDFHGHLCPDLLIGCRAANLALEKLKAADELHNGLFVTAQNRTSAIDAIQCLTGCTLGNQRLRLQDNGKHTYTFTSCSSGRAVELKLKSLSFKNEDQYFALEKKAEQDVVTIQEVSRMQAIMDTWVQWLSSRADAELFRIVEHREEPPRPEACNRYVTCRRCGDPVQVSRIIVQNGIECCRSCVQSAWFEPSGVVWQ
jgi:formylmethanofuran dehydrogenase subunit E